MPQVQVGVTLTYLSNTAIVRSHAFVLYPHHPIFLEVSFSLWMLSMHQIFNIQEALHHNLNSLHPR